MTNTDPSAQANLELTSWTRGDISEPYSIEGINHAELEAGLARYFETCALTLPVVVEDCFWPAYRQGTCSPALVYAIACRGIPFCDLPRKWELQQLLANSFRKCFLEHQCAQNEIFKANLLDDLEALALMSNFAYTRDAAHASETRLGSLFLSHDCLVIMSMRLQLGSTEEFQVQRGHESSADLRKRRTLLYWHIFGVDAFHCLNRKTVSQIRSDLPAPNLALEHGERGYLDAILALASIARNIVDTLCIRASQQRNGGRYLNDIESLHRSLAHWRTTSYDAWIQANSNTTTSSVDSEDQNMIPHLMHPITQLRAAVLGALDANCYFQIQDCISRLNLQEMGDIHNEMLMSLVRYHTLSAVTKVVSIAKSMLKTQQTSPQTSAWTDLSAHILRDICAGACTWLCLDEDRRTQSMCTTSEHPRAAQSRSASRLEAAKMLSEAVACAVSHVDTKEIVERLDTLIGSLGCISNLEN